VGDRGRGREVDEEMRVGDGKGISMDGRATERICGEPDLIIKC
jgi:hypothetical protein